MTPRIAKDKVHAREGTVQRPVMKGGVVEFFAEQVPRVAEASGAEQKHALQAAGEVLPGGRGGQEFHRSQMQRPLGPHRLFRASDFFGRCSRRGKRNEVCSSAPRGGVRRGPSRRGGLHRRVTRERGRGSDRALGRRQRRVSPLAMTLLRMLDEFGSSLISLTEFPVRHSFQHIIPLWAG